VTIQDILLSIILILQRLGAKKWRQFVLSSPAILKLLFTSHPHHLKNLILIYYSQFMNNADRFKTGQSFYALATQVTALIMLTSSIKKYKLNLSWLIVWVYLTLLTQ
jgi:hypothetical protein